MPCPTFFSWFPSWTSAIVGPVVGRPGRRGVTSSLVLLPSLFLLPRCMGRRKLFLGGSVAITRQLWRCFYLQIPKIHSNVTRHTRHNKCNKNNKNRLSSCLNSKGRSLEELASVKINWQWPLCCRATCPSWQSQRGSYAETAASRI